MFSDIINEVIIFQQKEKTFSCSTPYVLSFFPLSPILRQTKAIRARLDWIYQFAVRSRDQAENGIVLKLLNLSYFLQQR